MRVLLAFLSVTIRCVGFFAFKVMRHIEAVSL